MRIRIEWKWVAVLTAMTTVMLAAAQGPPPDGGPPMGGPGAILMNPRVQKELHLTDSQISQIEKTLPRPPRRGRGGPPGGPGGPPPGGPGGGPGFGPPPGEGGPGQRGPGQRPDGRFIDSKIKGILSHSQFQRYREIDLQWMGPRAILRPEVADELGLTDDQKQKIRSFAPGRPGGPGGPRGGPGGPPPDDARGGPPPGGPGGPGGPPPGGPGGGPGFGPPPGMGGPGGRGRGGERILSVLTKAQRQKWQAMQGRKFEFRPER